MNRSARSRVTHPSKIAKGWVTHIQDWARDSEQSREQPHICQPPANVGHPRIALRLDMTTCNDHNSAPRQVLEGSRMRNAIKLALVVLLVAAVMPAVAQNDDTVATITKLINDGIKADLAGDNTFMQKHSVDGFVEGTSFGTWMTRDQLMDLSKNKMNKAEVSDIKVNAFGDTAVARFRETYDGIVDGQHRSRTIICTQTWNKQDGDWKQIGNHCSQAK